MMIVVTTVVVSAMTGVDSTILPLSSQTVPAPLFFFSLLSLRAARGYF